METDIHDRLNNLRQIIEYLYLIGKDWADRLEASNQLAAAQAKKIGELEAELAAKNAEAEALKARIEQSEAYTGEKLARLETWYNNLQARTEKLALSYESLAGGQNAALAGVNAEIAALRKDGGYLKTIGEMEMFVKMKERVDNAGKALCIDATNIVAEKKNLEDARQALARERAEFEDLKKEFTRIYSQYAQRPDLAAQLPPLDAGYHQEQRPVGAYPAEADASAPVADYDALANNCESPGVTPETGSVNEGAQVPPGCKIGPDGRPRRSINRNDF